MERATTLVKDDGSRQPSPKKKVAIATVPAQSLSNHPLYLSLSLPHVSSLFLLPAVGGVGLEPILPDFPKKMALLLDCLS